MRSIPSPYRIIAVGDVHGQHGLLLRLLREEVRFDARRDRLVFLGDYIDRGGESREVVEYVERLRLAHPRSVVLLMGNHEAIAREALQRGDEQSRSLWFINGGQATVRSYGSFEQARAALLPFIATLERYHETSTHIFVHAGVDPERPPAETPGEILFWTREFLPHRSGKEVVVGHTIRDRVTFMDGVVAVDTGAFLSGMLSAYDATNRIVYTVREVLPD